MAPQVAWGLGSFQCNCDAVNMIWPLCECEVSRAVTQQPCFNYYHVPATQL